jgi:SAM-dependent methyltransferase
VSQDGAFDRPSCPSCQAAARPWCGRASAWLECGRCGLLFRHPLPSQEALDRLSAGAGAFPMASPAVALVGLAELIARLAPPGARILDFGAGTGELALCLRGRGFEVVGVERLAAARAAAAAAGLELHPDLTRLQPGSFDLVSAVEVIEHLRSPLAVLRDLRDLLVPGGRLFVTTPNRRGLRARLSRCRWRQARDPCHVILFDPRSLEGLLRAAGFVSVRLIRFSPLATANQGRILLQRALQALGLYGGLRVTAATPRSMDAAAAAPPAARGRAGTVSTSHRAVSHRELRRLSAAPADPAG